MPRELRGWLVRAALRHGIHVDHVRLLEVRAEEDKALRSVEVGEFDRAATWTCDFSTLREHVRQSALGVPAGEAASLACTGDVQMRRGAVEHFICVDDASDEAELLEFAVLVWD